MNILKYVVILGLITTAYQMRYELSLVSPTYSVGQCVKYDYSDEFTLRFATYQVMKVSDQYDLLAYDHNDNTSLGLADPENLKEVDQNFERIPCPDFITI